MNSNKNKNYNPSTFIKVFEIIFKSDKALAISVFFSLTLSTIILKYSNINMFEAKDALYFMAGISILFIILRNSLKKNNHIQFVLKNFNYILGKIIKAERCSKCHRIMNIKINNKNEYVWFCDKHKNSRKKVILDCPICKAPKSLKNSSNNLSKCMTCHRLFSYFDLANIIENKYKLLIQQKTPKIYKIESSKLAKYDKLIAFVSYSIILSLLNYILINSDASEFLATLFETASELNITIS